MRLKPQTYALTVLTSQRRRVFQRTLIAELFIDTLFRYRDAGKFKLHAFAIMPDHMHVLITPSQRQTLPGCIQFLKGTFSHAIRDQFKGEVWHSGHHEHRIRDREDFENQQGYIARNPERRHLTDHPYVHTKWPAQIDPMPSHLK